jgi:hypothetical protein
MRKIAFTISVLCLMSCANNNKAAIQKVSNALDEFN